MASEDEKSLSPESDRSGPDKWFRYHRKMSDTSNFSRRSVLPLIGAATLATPHGMSQSPVVALGSAPDQPRALDGPVADTGTMFPDIVRLSKRQDFTHSFLGSKYRDIAAYRQGARSVMLDALGMAPPKVAPRAEVVHKQDLGTFTREKILFSTTPEFRVPAYLHMPKERKGKIPAIVDLHSHGGMFIFGKEKVIDFGQNHPAMVRYHKENYEGRPTATELVKRGYAVITIDAFGFGERRILMEDDKASGWDRAKYTVEDVDRLNRRCRTRESTIVKTLSYAGYTWPGVIAWDDMRTVDYLASRPEVDASRIGCVGVSLGGYRSLMLAGLEDRVRAAVVVGFMSTVHPMMERHIDTHSFIHFIPRVHESLDLPDIVAMRAPLPLFVQQCRQDGLFPLKGMEQAVEKIAAIYKKAGSSQTFKSQFYEQKHIFNVEMQNDAFAWLDQQLKA